ncbi:tyrosine-type recombinase/integrase [Pseudodesulfovibrio indicus]|uniref:Phage integrase family protein n=1 Tax=Pseudodesulfovibrio indicus TaxID=1716143 RepID=A0AA94TR20_9BACT|nr:tyrosine-type recombinase/integrase [Pseudodesulfovibrio indicus]TDT91764.1 phage integrase family protein [Pseudodesulfovibrio indicus]
MVNRFKILEITLEGGERLPVLLAPDGTLPFLPAYYVMSMCRPRDSANTITVKLTAIKILLEWAALNEIDLKERFRSGKMLTGSERDNLLHACRLHFNTLMALQQTTVVKLGGDAIKTVNNATAAQRIHYIAHYLNWMGSELIKNIDRSRPEFGQLHKVRANFVDELRLRAVRRIGRSQSRSNPPRGFSKKVQDRIVEVIVPGHPDNPWKNAFVQIRNQLYITMCLAFGLRIGESLCIKLQDVRLSGNCPRIEIVRRPDDPEDDRNPAPQVKTLPRPLPLNSNQEKSWTPLIHRYLTNYRRRLKKARNHKFFFVARNGEKLSYSSAISILKTLRNVSGIPDDLTQHLVRHACNERFSENAEALQMSADDVREARRQLMGWGPASRMPELYDQRFIQNKAHEISMEMQEDFFINRKLK